MHSFLFNPPIPWRKIATNSLSDARVALIDMRNHCKSLATGMDGCVIQQGNISEADMAHVRSSYEAFGEALTRMEQAIKS